MPIDISRSKVSDYDLAVLRSTFLAFASKGSEWGRGAQAGMLATASILGIDIEGQA